MDYLEKSSNVTGEELLENPLKIAFEFLGLDENREEDQETIAGFIESAVPNWIRDKSEVTRDDRAWCAAFANDVLNRGGLETLESDDGGWSLLRAKNYAKLGDEVNTIENAKPGDIIVLNNKGGDGHHVAFFAGEKNGKYKILGGNQSDKVSVQEINMNKNNIVSIRRLNNIRETDKDFLNKLYSSGHSSGNNNTGDANNFR